MKELKMIGRKPKIHSFVYERMCKNEATGKYYQEPYKTVYMTLSDPACETQHEYGYNLCKCIPGAGVSIEHCGDDNDITSECLVCHTSVYYHISELTPDMKYFKWAVTGKANKKLFEKLSNG